MVAHSQGCLLLRLALEALVSMGMDVLMKERLYIFTFGNPSIHWKIETDGRALSNFTARTEHFANERDFVAQLGVIAKRGGSYSGEDRVFIRKGSGGHLFRSQLWQHRDAPKIA